MQRKISLLLLLCVVLPCTSIQIYAKAMLSVREAKTTIWKFTGKKTSFMTFMPVQPHSYWAEDEDATYTVDRLSGKVLCMNSKHRREPVNETEFQEWRSKPDLPKQEILRRALRYVRQHYEGPASKYFHLFKADLDSKEWRIYYMERLPENGAYTDNGVTLDLSRKDGQIWSYQARYVEIPPSARRRPFLQVDELKSLIAHKSKSSQVEINQATLSVNRVGELIWFVRSTVVDDQGRPQPYGMTLRDSTGEVVNFP